MKQTLIFDTECYKDWWCIAFRNPLTGNVRFFELYEGHPLDIESIRKILSKYKIVGFNSINYDIPQLFYALTGASTKDLKASSDYIIVGGYKSWHCEAKFGFKISDKIEHVDIIEILIGKASLKAYGARLHTKLLQDLPIDPSASISPEQREELKIYCANDLLVTQELYEHITPQLELREKMSKEYGINLMSRSDAQIAEHVIRREVERLKNSKIDKPETNIKPFKYKKPFFISFDLTLLKEVMNTVVSSVFYVSDGGKVLLPKEISDLKITIGNSTYKMGVGGLHSTESGVSYEAKDDHVILDADCKSFYPNIILNQRLYPETMGKHFLTVYNKIVNERLAAKQSGDKMKAESLKTTINGSFGKFGNKYSTLYSPSLLIQTTITGQLALLMLIEQLETSGISVVSANTDGLVIYCSKNDVGKVRNIIGGWELITGFETEETQYKAIYMRDVNSYCAIKDDGVKLKGAYTVAGLSKNPTTEICSEAVVKFLSEGKDINTTIRNCKDIRKFVSVRKVTGGAIKDGVYLGKVVRWYYSQLAFGYIEYKLNGNKVPQSEGAQPCMTLPDQFPDDIDFNWYVNEANKILKEIGYAGEQGRESLKKASA